MNPACIDPALRDSLLDGGRPGGPGFSPEELGHLEICASCCAALEQQRRLVGAWASLEPTAREVAYARARLLTRPGKRSSAKLVPKAAALVVVLAAAAASAAVQVAVTHFASPPPAPVATVEPGPPARAPKPRRFKGAAPRHAEAVASSEPECAPESAPEPAPAPAPIAADPLPVGPPAVEVSVNDLPLAPAPIVARRVAAAPPPPPPPKASAPESAPASAWGVAASALRVGDYALAEAAFDQLARSGDSSTRDAARLARAQVWIAQGRGVEARPALEGLATSGATPLVRKRAADLLEALP